jgi:hypothetical protein
MTIIAECIQNSSTQGPRYVIVDPFGHIYEVTDLFDQFGERTLDPRLASTCVIRFDADHWLPQNADDVPIYTVH